MEEKKLKENEASSEKEEARIWPLFLVTLDRPIAPSAPAQCYEEK